MRKMKDSGVDWIDVIPEGWSIVPLKTAVSFGKGLPITKADLTESGIAVVSYGQIHSKSNIGSHLKVELVRYVSEAYLASNPNCLARKGDIFIADTSEDYEGIGNAVLVDWDRAVFAGYHTVIISPMDRKYSKYLAYLFMTDAWRNQLRSRASGIKVFSVTQGLLKKTAIILPCEDCIERVTDYLDSKCGKIDTIISLQENIIDKLKEYKNSLIDELVVTKTGEKVRVGHLGEMKNGLNFSASPSGNSILFLGVGDFKDNFVLSEREQFSNIITQDSFDEDYYLRNEDIVFVRSNGSKSLVGRAVMVENIDYPVTYSGFCIRFRNTMSDIVDSRYLLYFFHSPYFRKELEKYSQGSNISNINQELLSGVRFFLPKISEQKQIVCFLDDKIKAIDLLISKKERIIENLVTYKKSLVYEVVTGKKEV